MPEMAPVVVLKERPAGRAGEMDQAVTVPVTVGTSAVIGLFWVAAIVVWG